jgi:hypothetical protein
MTSFQAQGLVERYLRNGCFARSGLPAIGSARVANAVAAFVRDDLHDVAEVEVDQLVRVDCEGITLTITSRDSSTGTPVDYRTIKLRANGTFGTYAYTTDDSDDDEEPALVEHAARAAPAIREACEGLSLMAPETAFYVDWREEGKDVPITFTNSFTEEHRALPRVAQLIAFVDRNHALEKPVVQFLHTLRWEHDPEAVMEPLLCELYTGREVFTRDAVEQIGDKVVARALAQHQLFMDLHEGRLVQAQLFADEDGQGPVCLMEPTPLADEHGHGPHDVQANPVVATQQSSLFDSHTIDAMSDERLDAEEGGGLREESCEADADAGHLDSEEVDNPGEIYTPHVPGPDEWNVTASDQEDAHASPLHASKDTTRLLEQQEQLTVTHRSELARADSEPAPAPDRDEGSGTPAHDRLDTAVESNLLLGPTLSMEPSSKRSRTGDDDPAPSHADYAIDPLAQDLLEVPPSSPPTIESGAAAINAGATHASECLGNSTQPSPSAPPQGDRGDRQGDEGRTGSQAAELEQGATGCQPIRASDSSGVLAQPMSASPGGSNVPAAGQESPSKRSRVGEGNADDNDENGNSNDGEESGSNIGDNGANNNKGNSRVYGAKAVQRSAKISSEGNADDNDENGNSSDGEESGSNNEDDIGDDGADDGKGKSTRSSRLWNTRARSWPVGSELLRTTAPAVIISMEPMGGANDIQGGEADNVDDSDEAPPSGKRARSAQKTLRKSRAAKSSQKSNSRRRTQNESKSKIRALLEECAQAMETRGCPSHFSAIQIVTRMAEDDYPWQSEGGGTTAARLTSLNEFAGVSKARTWLDRVKIAFGWRDIVSGLADGEKLPDLANFKHLEKTSIAQHVRMLPFVEECPVLCFAQKTFTDMRRILVKSNRDIIAEVWAELQDTLCSSDD